MEEAARRGKEGRVPSAAGGQRVEVREKEEQGRDSRVACITSELFGERRVSLRSIGYLAEIETSHCSKFSPTFNPRPLLVRSDSDRFKLKDFFLIPRGSRITLSFRATPKTRFLQTSGILK